MPADSSNTPSRFRRYYYENHQKCRASRKAYYEANRAKELARQVQRRMERKIRVISHYSDGTMRCALCPEDRIGALTIDHVGGGGTAHRRSIGLTCGGTRFYDWLEKNQFPSGYRVLCSNCNILAHLATVVVSEDKRCTAERLRGLAMKQRVMNQLGGRCSTCDKADLRILTIHHVNDNGADHRTSLSGGRAGVKFYRALIKSGDFSGLECRCYSCNDSEEWS